MTGRPFHWAFLLASIPALASSASVQGWWKTPGGDTLLIADAADPEFAVVRGPESGKPVLEQARWVVGEEGTHFELGGAAARFDPKAPDQIALTKAGQPAVTWARTARTSRPGHATGLWRAGPSGDRFLLTPGSGDFEVLHLSESAPKLLRARWLQGGAFSVGEDGRGRFVDSRPDHLSLEFGGVRMGLTRLRTLAGPPAPSLTASEEQPGYVDGAATGWIRTQALDFWVEDIHFVRVSTHNDSSVPCEVTVTYEFETQTPTFVRLQARVDLEDESWLQTDRWNVTTQGPGRHVYTHDTTDQSCWGAKPLAPAFSRVDLCYSPGCDPPLQPR